MNKITIKMYFIKELVSVLALNEVKIYIKNIL